MNEGKQKKERKKERKKEEEYPLMKDRRMKE
jgi:hypothetical protein